MANLQLLLQMALRRWPTFLSEAVVEAALALALAPTPTTMAPTVADILSSHVPSFVPPVSTNPTTSVSSSLLFQFPLVEVAVIMAIMTYKFHSSDLYKLDPQYWDKADQCILALNGDTLELQLQTGDSSTKEYRSLNLVIISLSTYFLILGSAIAPITLFIELVILGSWAYIASLMTVHLRI